MDPAQIFANQMLNNFQNNQPPLHGMEPQPWAVQMMQQLFPNDQFVKEYAANFFHNLADEGKKEVGKGIAEKIFENGKSAFFAGGALFWGAAKGEAIKQGIGVAKGKIVDAIPGLFPKKHECEQYGMKKFKELIVNDVSLASDCAFECASKTNAECMSIDIDAFKALLNKDPSEALIFAMQCADKNTPQCSTIGKEALKALSEKSTVKAEALKKKCENLETTQCQEINT